MPFLYPYLNFPINKINHQIKSVFTQVVDGNNCQSSYCEAITRPLAEIQLIHLCLLWEELTNSLPHCLIIQSTVSYYSSKVSYVCIHLIG